MMKIIYVCAPFDESPERNLQHAQQYLRYALKHNAIPLIPCWYEEAFKNTTAREINRAKNIPGNLLYFCDEMWVFGNRRTPAMRTQIDYCEKSNKPFVLISDKHLKTILKQIGDDALYGKEKK